MIPEYRSLYIDKNVKIEFNKDVIQFMEQEKLYYDLNFLKYYINIDSTLKILTKLLLRLIEMGINIAMADELDGYIYNEYYSNGITWKKGIIKHVCSAIGVDIYTEHTFNEMKKTSNKCRKYKVTKIVIAYQDRIPECYKKYSLRGLDLNSNNILNANELLDMNNMSIKMKNGNIIPIQFCSQSDNEFSKTIIPVKDYPQKDIDLGTIVNAVVKSHEYFGCIHQIKTKLITDFGSIIKYKFGVYVIINIYDVDIAVLIIDNVIMLDSITVKNRIVFEKSAPNTIKSAIKKRNSKKEVIYMNEFGWKNITISNNNNNTPKGFWSPPKILNKLINVSPKNNSINIIDTCSLQLNNDSKTDPNSDDDDVKNNSNSNNNESNDIKLTSNINITHNIINDEVANDSPILIPNSIQDTASMIYYKKYNEQLLDANAFIDEFKARMKHYNNNNYNTQSSLVTNDGPSVIALYNFDSKAAPEISMDKLDILELLEVSSELNGWAYARHKKNDEVGYVPKSYIALFDRVLQLILEKGYGTELENINKKSGQYTIKRYININRANIELTFEKHKNGTWNLITFQNTNKYKIYENLGTFLKRMKKLN